MLTQYTKIDDMQQKQYSKFLVIKAYIKKEKIYPTNNLTSHLKAIGKEDQTNTKEAEGRKQQRLYSRNKRQRE